jgi:hypothetical protein
MGKEHAPTGGEEGIDRDLEGDLPLRVPIGRAVETDPHDVVETAGGIDPIEFHATEKEKVIADGPPRPIDAVIGQGDKVIPAVAVPRNDLVWGQQPVREGAVEMERAAKPATRLVKRIREVHRWISPQDQRVGDGDQRDLAARWSLRPASDWVCGPSIPPRA